MADYNLQGLNPRDFQHLIQAIARQEISPAVAAFGDGPDGGRDLSSDGTTHYPSPKRPWDGYLIIGCKFRLAPSTPNADLTWLKTQAKRDLAKFRRRRKGRPKYYLLATNVRLTASRASGTRDKIAEFLGSMRSDLGLEDIGVWDYHDIRGFLDAHADIRRAYGHLVTAGDVLSSLAEQLGSRVADFGSVARLCLEKELNSELSAKLQSAGEDPEVRIPLATVFLDLPFADSSEETTVQERAGTTALVVKTLLASGARVLRPTNLRSEYAGGSEAQRNEVRAFFVVVGGPGQGKSTLAQYLCQLYRAALLKDMLDSAARNEQTTTAIEQLVAGAEDPRGLPLARRFPVNVELRAFSAALLANSRLTLMQYIRDDLQQLSNMPFRLDVLRDWLRQFPWLLVLDGLDEVPPSSNRLEVMKAIDHFRIDATALDADLMVVATTRPQSYSKEFSAGQFKHLFLRPLDPTIAMTYAKKLVSAKYPESTRQKAELLASLNKACRNDATARLMQSPLQVTIMATLLEETGEPPQQRFRLFLEYYRTIYRRETRRKLLGGILSERQTDMDFIHAATGLLLHAAAEPSQSSSQGKVDGRNVSLSDEQFRRLVTRRLEHIGVAGELARDLVQRIADSSLQRLVFLVRQQEGAIRFDLTSLQEFMAAEALTAGSDELVKRRMEAVSGASYWRNVFLFGVGKCFVHKEHLLTDVLSPSLKLNDRASAAHMLGCEVAAEVAALTLAGSRLALDVLVDGSARQSPRFESQLARLALELVRIPDPSVQARLASVCTDELTKEFQAAIGDRFGQASMWARIGAWQLLVAAADSGLSWARELGNRNWPTDIRERADLIDSLGRLPLRDWSMAKAVEVADALGPGLMQRFIYRISVTSSELPPRWKLLQQFARHDGSALVPVRMPNEVTGFRAVAMLRPLEFVTRSKPLLQAFMDQPNPWPGWRVLSTFASAPSANALADSLRLAASEQVTSYQLRDYSSWPLGACLAWASSPEELVELAERAAAGEFGDLEDWQEAEKRWKTQGIILADFESMVEDHWPLHRGIGKVGYAFAGAYSFPADIGGELADRARIAAGLKKLVGWLRSAPGPSMAAWLGEFAFDALAFEAGSGGVNLEIADLAFVVSQARGSRKRGPRRIPLDVLRASLLGRRIAEVDARALCVISESEGWIVGDEAWDNGEEIASYLQAGGSEYLALLPLCVSLCEIGTRLPLSRRFLQETESVDEQHRPLLYLLLLAQDDVSDEDMRAVVNRLLCLGNHRHLYSALRIAEKRSKQFAAKVAIAILETCSASSKQDYHLRNRATEVALGYIAAVPSRLQEGSNWTKLQLVERD